MRRFSCFFEGKMPPGVHLEAWCMLSSDVLLAAFNILHNYGAYYGHWLLSYTEAGAVADFTLCQGLQVPLVICNEENDDRRQESGTTEARGESMTLRLTFGVLSWTLEDTDLRWYVSCQSPSDKLSLWSRIFLYFVCAQILGSLLQVSSTCM